MIHAVSGQIGFLSPLRLWYVQAWTEDVHHPLSQQRTITIKRKKGFSILLATVLGGLLVFAGCKGQSSHGNFALDYITESLDLSKSLESQLAAIKEELIPL